MKLTIICSWCGVKIGEKECECLDESLSRITHSICSECHSKVIDDLKQTYGPKQENKSQTNM